MLPFSNGQYVMCGSDDGRIYFWDKSTQNLIRVLEGDSQVVNALCPHPSTCLLATSGIDNVVRVWEPMPKGKPNPRVVYEVQKAVNANQTRLKMSPLQSLLYDGSLMRFSSDSDMESD